MGLDSIIEWRWPNGIACPRCQDKKVQKIATRQTWRCRGCGRQFSAKTGTTFENSHLPLSLWLKAIEFGAQISTHELARALGITQKTAWYMKHRLGTNRAPNSAQGERE
jgi:transposase-like protein